VGVRVDDEEEMEGLDESIHGESAYNLQLSPVASPMVHGGGVSEAMHPLPQGTKAFAQK
jgi:hypothetical protein